MWILFLLLMIGTAQADVYVLTSADKAVVGLSEQNDIVVPAGHKLDMIKNKKISDLSVTMGEEKMYDFDGSKFKINAKKVQDKNKADSDAVIAEQKRVNDKQSAIEKIKSVAGLTDDEIKAVLK